MLNGKPGLKIFVLLSPQVALSSVVQQQVHHSTACVTEKLRAAGPSGEVMLLGEGLHEAGPEGMPRHAPGARGSSTTGILTLAYGGVSREEIQSYPARSVRDGSSSSPWWHWGLTPCWAALDPQGRWPALQILPSSPMSQ